MRKRGLQLHLHLSKSDHIHKLGAVGRILRAVGLYAIQVVRVEGLRGTGRVGSRLFLSGGGVYHNQYFSNILS
jgi:hypothetical protein